jgi:hypothetical protein
MHVALSSIDLAMEYSYQELPQQWVAFGCIKWVDFLAFYNIFGQLLLRVEDALVHYPIAVSGVDQVNNINIIFLQHLSNLLVFCGYETVTQHSVISAHLFALGDARKVMSTFNSYSFTDVFPCFQIIGIRSEMLVEPSVHPAYNERTALPFIVIALLLTRMASHRNSCRSSKALPIPLHALEWVICPVWHASNFPGVQV